MVVGICQLSIILRGNHSLKEKRRDLHRIRDRVRSRFNVAIAEIGSQDLWQRALIALCAVGNEQKQVSSTLDLVIDQIERIAVGEIVAREIEILNVHPIAGG